MRFVYNITLGRFVEGAGATAPMTTTPRAKRRDAARLEVRLETGDAWPTTVKQLADGTGMTFALKKENNWPGAAVVLGSGWAWDDTEQLYYAEPSFNTWRMAALFVGAVSLNPQSSGAYTLALTDASDLVVTTHASANTVTVPLNSSVAFAVGAVVYVMRGSAGTGTLAATDGVTLTYEDELTSVMAANVVVKLTKTGTDAWTVSLPTEQNSITLMGEWSWQEPAADAPTSTSTLTWTVDNDVIRGDEGTPLNSDDPSDYYTKPQADALFLAIADAGALATKDSVGNADITDGAVSNAKLADMPSSRLKGRASVGSGVPENLTLTQVLDMVGSATRGDVFYRGASDWVRLPAGTSGHFLKTLGSGADPAWAALPAPGAGTITTSMIVDGAVSRAKLNLPRAVLAADRTLSLSTAALDALASAFSVPAGHAAVGDVFEVCFSGIHSVSATTFTVNLLINGSLSTAAQFASATASVVPFRVMATVLIVSTTQALVSLMIIKSGTAPVEITPGVMTIDTAAGFTINARATAGAATSQSTTWKMGFISQRA